jgi:hypothetical protein
MALTAPDRWREVVEHFPTLRVNFAHFGGPEHPDRRRTITNDILAHRGDLQGTTTDWIYPNVYTDIAIRGTEPGFYSRFAEWRHGVTLLNRTLHPDECTHLRDRLLFGSDFTMNLFTDQSHLEYVERFLTATAETLDSEIPPETWDTVRHMMVCQNPETFLFANGAQPDPAPVTTTIPQQ